MMPRPWGRPNNQAGEGKAYMGHISSVTDKCKPLASGCPPVPAVELPPLVALAVPQSTKARP